MFDVDDLPCKIACQMPRGDRTEGKFHPDDWMEPKEQRKVDDFIVFAMAAAARRWTTPTGIRRAARTRSPPAC